MRFAQEYPEDYEERLESLLDAADNERKYRMEHGLCVSCGSPDHSTKTCTVYPWSEGNR